MYIPKIKSSYSFFLKMMLIIFLLINVTGILLANDAESTIKVGTFNLKILGTTKIKRPNTLKTLASIATRFDILAMQEVGSNNSTSSYETCEKILKTFTEEVNKVAGSEIYTHKHGDQYAFIYRKDRIELISYELYSGSQTFQYTPLVANFEIIDGNLDFLMITIHTRPNLAKTEIPALKISISEIVDQYSENDVICLGDFNADGDYYNEGEHNSLYLEGFDDFITGIPNTADTTVSSNDYTYDRIQMTNSMESDFTKRWGVLIFNDYYDVTICEGTDNTEGTESALSDHYPVWVELYINQDDD